MCSTGRQLLFSHWAINSYYSFHLTAMVDLSIKSASVVLSRRKSLWRFKFDAYNLPVFGCRRTCEVKLEGLVVIYIMYLLCRKRNKASASSGLRIVVSLGLYECPTAIKVRSLPVLKPFILCRAKGFCYLCFRDRQKHDAVAAVCACWRNCPCWGRCALHKSALRQAPKNKTRWNY